MAVGVGGFAEFGSESALVGVSRDGMTWTVDELYRPDGVHPEDPIDVAGMEAVDGLAVVYGTTRTGDGPGGVLWAWSDFGDRQSIFLGPLVPVGVGISQDRVVVIATDPDGSIHAVLASR